MIEHFAGWEQDTLDLVVERYTVGLTDQDVAALERRTDGADLEEFECVVAAIHLASLRKFESPPSALLSRLERDGREQVLNNARMSVARTGAAIDGGRNWVAWTGWLVAASLLAFFFLRGVEGINDPVMGRDELIASAADLVRVDWTATEDLAAAGAAGDVVWSSEQQTGYMRFRGLEPNDPEQAQYQLWIFDPTRADWEAKPVDGGVFDVSDKGEVIVPIDAKLAVRKTALFAVTVEVPGGVVVSNRERLVLTAAL